MAGYDLLLLVGFFIGTVFYGVLLLEIFRRYNRLFHEYIFILLIIILGLWHLFQFSALAIKLVFGRTALEIYTELRYYALHCIAFFPPLLLHLHSSFLGYIREQIGKSTAWHKWLPMLMYLPVFFIMYIGQYTIIDYRKRILDENLSFIPYFVFFTIVCLWLSAALSVWIILINRNERWRQFFIVEAISIVVISALLIYFYFYGGTGNIRLDKSLRTLLVVSAILPTGALIYLLYKYPFFSLFARSGFLSLILAGIYLSIYIITSREIQKTAEDNPDINVYTLETLLVCILFITYEPVKNLIRRLAGAKALSERYMIQTLLRNVSESIAGSRRLDEILQVIRNPVQSALQVEDMALFTTGQNPESGEMQILQSFGEVRPFNLKKVIKGLKQGNGIYEPRKIYSFHLTSADLSYQIYAGIYLKNSLTGILGLGKKAHHDNFTFEEKEILLTLANQIAIAIENIETTRRQIELESKILEAEKLSALGMLATSIAHEVKNPLSSIKSIVQAMIHEQSQSGAFEENRQDLVIINEEINRLASVVDQLLRFARTEPSDGNGTDLQRIIETILSILRHEMRRWNIQPKVLFPEYPLWIPFSPGHLKEIIFNLIINAIHSMEKTGGRLYIQASWLSSDRPLPEEGGYTWINGIYYTDELESEKMVSHFQNWSNEQFKASPLEKTDSRSVPISEKKPKALFLMIRDTGIGIPHATVSEIFKPFFTTKSGGTGMGLAIVKNKIHLLGGQLLLKSRPGEGTSFEIYLPHDHKTPAGEL